SQRKNVERWLELTAAEFEPTKVIAIGASLSEVARDALRDFPCDVIGLERPYDKPVSLGGSSVGRTDRALVLIDVIGTGSTLRSVLDVCGDAKATWIAAVVDARQGDQSEDTFSYGTKQFPLHSVLCAEQSYYDDR